MPVSGGSVSRNRFFYQKAALAALVFLVALLSVDVLGLFGLGDSKASQSSVLTSSTIAEWGKLDDTAKEYLAKEHDTVVEEIRNRIEHEHLLFSLKFALVGGILYALLQGVFGSGEARIEKTPLAALTVWAAVVASAIVDLRLMANQSFIVTLARWVRRYEELKLGKDSVSLAWEPFLADELLSQPYYPALRVSGQVLTALLFAFSAVLFLLRREGDSDPNTPLVSGACATVSIVLMTMAAISLRPTRLAMSLDLIFGAVAITIALALAYASTEPTLPDNVARTDPT